MAGEQPLASSAPPGAFPETDEDKSYSVNPIPASAGTGNPVNLAPGEKVPDPASINSNTIGSTVHDDPELKAAHGGDQTVSVDPIPATGGAGNPISLAPGEKVPPPSSVTGNTIVSNVRLDKESYEKSDAGAPVLPPPLSPTSEREAAGAPIFGLGPQTGNAIIPESGLPMGKQADLKDLDNMGPTMSSVAPTSTTNQLAGAVPKEPRGVPEVVGESQQEANAPPEASANPEAVNEKSEVEQELKKAVPEQPATSESGLLGNSERGVTGAIAGGIAAAGAAAAGAAYAMRDQTKATTGVDPASVLPQSVQDKINHDSAAGAPTSATITDVTKDTGMPQQFAANEPVQVPADVAQGARETTHDVPEEVTASQKEAHVGPEAAANPEAVREKEKMEKELLRSVKPAQALGEPAPSKSAALTETAPAATGTTTTSASGAPQLADPVAGVTPLDLNSKDGLNASADSPAVPPTARANLAPSSDVLASGDVSPMTRPSDPIVTTGVASSTAPKQSKGTSDSAPQRKRQSMVERLRPTPDSSKSGTSGASGDDSQKKRKGFFGKLKEKFKS